MVTLLIILPGSEVLLVCRSEALADVDGAVEPTTELKEITKAGADAVKAALHDFTSLQVLNIV